MTQNLRDCFVDAGVAGVDSICVCLVENCRNEMSRLTNLGVDRSQRTTSASQVPVPENVHDSLKTSFELTDSPLEIHSPSQPVKEGSDFFLAARRRSWKRQVEQWMFRLRKKGGKWSSVVFLVGAWYVMSLTLTAANKILLDSLAFPYPLFVTFIHFSGVALLARTVSTPFSNVLIILQLRQRSISVVPLA